MDIWGRIVKVSGNFVTIGVESAEELAKLSLETTETQPQVVIHVQDERSISVLQRKKAHAIIGEIAKWSGYLPEEAKAWMKYLFTAETGYPDFSFADTDMTTAREFITFVLNYAVSNHIPMSHSGLTLQDDLEAYMKMSLLNRSCVICGRHADIHHIDAIGMGNDRLTADHRDRRLIALCREHHQTAHNMGWPAFSQQWHVEGVTLSELELQKLGLMTKKRMQEIDGNGD